MSSADANREILFMNPVFKQMIWGGNKLGSKWGYEIPGENTGECWAVSAHPNGDCVIKEGTYAGKTLSQLWSEEPQLFGNAAGDRFPLLIKIIDANDDLSIQVHPDDEYAGKNENGSFGKTECWYILDAPEGAALVIGHNAKDKAELADMIGNGRWDEFLREVPVKKGDFIQIDPGTVHAIKGGIEILETQQNSDITYRVYDYGRLQNGRPRELHIEKSIDVITVPAKSVEESVINIPADAKNTMNQLISCNYYQVWKLDVDGSMEVSQDYPFLIMSVVEGDGLINGQMIKKGDHFILPSGYGKAQLQGKMELIASAVAK
ncbi:MAG: mannose-6-phosphate isomerase, class I [Lachnospiraceae bacterium]|nr:mannose-6-phosphate isomerase, class I [Lachnospiraceae bacterium]